jgi:hypothetical protein
VGTRTGLNLLEPHENCPRVSTTFCMHLFPYRGCQLWKLFANGYKNKNLNTSAVTFGALKQSRYNPSFIVHHSTIRTDFRINHIVKVKGKIEVVPLNSVLRHEGVLGSGDIAPLIL